MSGPSVSIKYKIDKYFILSIGNDIQQALKTLNCSVLAEYQCQALEQDN